MGISDAIFNILVEHCTIFFIFVTLQIHIFLEINVWHTEFENVQLPGFIMVKYRM